VGFIEVLLFLDIRDKDLMLSQLKDVNWKTDLAFLIDVLDHINNLNVTLQGKYFLVIELYTTSKTKISEVVMDNKYTCIPTLSLSLSLSIYIYIYIYICVCFSADVKQRNNWRHIQR
jgi:hypothetical protein